MFLAAWRMLPPPLTAGIRRDGEGLGQSKE
jgi:hypothetical protein